MHTSTQNLLATTKENDEAYAAFRKARLEAGGEHCPVGLLPTPPDPHGEAAAVQPANMAVDMDSWLDAGAGDDEIEDLEAAKKRLSEGRGLIRRAKLARSSPYGGGVASPTLQSAPTPEAAALQASAIQAAKALAGAADAGTGNAGGASGAGGEGFGPVR